MDTKLRVLSRLAASGDRKAQEALGREESRTMDAMTIVIDGETYTVENVTASFDDHATVEVESGEEYWLFPSTEEAGKAARSYWEDMAQNDPSEFRAIIGDETLVSWALGQWAGPGTTQTRSLTEWLNLHLGCPEEHFASYDGITLGITRVANDLRDELGFRPTVAYRSN